MALKMSNKARSRIKKAAMEEREEEFRKKEEWLEKQAQLVHWRVFFTGFACGLGFASVINYLQGV